MSSKFLLLLILLLASFLRFYKLGSYPVSLSWDEAAIGYNAYSISKTSADEYGNKFPHLFKSFNDYKLPGYIYVDALFVKFLGLSEFTVRLPSAIFGIITVTVMYYLSKELTANFASQKEKWKLHIPILSAFLIAVNPWHLQMSRAAFEANAALAIVTSGVVALFFGLKNRWWALVSIPLLCLSLYFYYSPRIFAPTILIAFLVLFVGKIQKNIKYFFYGFVIAATLSLPILIQTFSPEGLKRIQEVSVIKNTAIIENYVKAQQQNPSFISKIFLNRRIPVIESTLQGYFSHFSIGFLFFANDPNPRHRSDIHGNFFIIEIITIILGAIILIRNKNIKTRILVVIWILVAPIPAALAKDAPHGLRALLLLPPLIFLSAIGLSRLLQTKTYTIAAIVVIFGMLMLNYWFSYYKVYPQSASTSWAYGYKELFSYLKHDENNFDRIIVTGHYWKPYIFYLFYNKIEPQIAWQNTQEAIGKYRFGTTVWDSGGQDFNDQSIDNLIGTNTLIAISPQEFENINNKERFKKHAEIEDFSRQSPIFLVGTWD